MGVTKKEINTELSIKRLNQHSLKLRMIGRTPLYFNSMSAKAQRDLLIGAKKKTAAEKQLIKHNPENEFRSSMHTQETGDTLLCFPAMGVKGAMATAALETDGIKKTTVQRLIFLPQEQINIWGTPYLKMDVVKSADMNRTPDIRTRAFLPNWCAEITIEYVSPALNPHSVVSLLSNAGPIIGLGDFRQEKGRGSYGTFDVFDSESDNEVWDEITKENREVQQAAWDEPVAHDRGTRELMQEIIHERMRRDEAA